VEWVEISGRTLEEAKEIALEQLGVAESDAELIVLAEPKVGLFGRTRGEARVRARVQPVGPRPKRQRRPRKSESGRNGGPSRNGERSRPSGGGQSGDRVKSERPAQGSEANAAGSRSSRRSRSGSRGGNGRASSSGEGARPAKATGRGSNDQDRQDKEADMAEGVTLEEQAEAAKDFMEGLLEVYGYEASVETRVLDEDTIEVAAIGGELGLLVGPRGSTLAALQDVTRTVVQHRFPTRTDRIVVDVGGYRQRRVAALQRFTRQVADEVTESGTERALEPMSPADRKVVHDTVNEIEGLVTRSEGEDSARHVVIAPAS
jgi:spoIIIJ-associated protein